MNDAHINLINSIINVNKNMIPKESIENVIEMLKNKYPNYSI